LGNLLRAKGNYEEAVSAFEQAISLYPEKEEYHYHLGLVFSAQKRHDDAIREFQKVISLNPEYVLARGALAGNLRRIGREDEATQQISYILPKMQDEKEYNRACFEAICGNTERAIEFLRIALERKQTPLDWVRCDPDLDSIRDDPRFIALVGRGI
jgi:tetratricopeptide (TPR) repeat protein